MTTAILIPLCPTIADLEELEAHLRTSQALARHQFIAWEHQAEETSAEIERQEMALSAAMDEEQDDEISAASELLEMLNVKLRREQDYARSAKQHEGELRVRILGLEVLLRAHEQWERFSVRERQHLGESIVQLTQDLTACSGEIVHVRSRGGTDELFYIHRETVELGTRLSAEVPVAATHHRPSGVLLTLRGILVFLYNAFVIAKEVGDLVVQVVRDRGQELQAFFRLLQPLGVPGLR